MLIISLSCRMMVPLGGSDCRFKDLYQSVKDDVDFLKESPLVLDVPISGYNVSFLLLKDKPDDQYDVKTGKIHKVV